MTENLPRVAGVTVGGPMSLRIRWRGVRAADLVGLRDGLPRVAMFWRRCVMSLYLRGRELKTTARLSLGALVILRSMPFT